MPFWTSLRIERFRRLRDLKLEGLRKVNLLVGRNNSGKTSVLEALALLSQPTSASNWIDTAREREIKPVRTPLPESISSFFPQESPRTNSFKSWVLAGGTLSTGEEWDLRARYLEVSLFSLKPPQETGVPLSELEDDDSGYGAQLEVMASANSPGKSAETRTHAMQADIRARHYQATAAHPPILSHQLVTTVSHRTNSLPLVALTKVITTDRKAQIIRLLQILAPDVEDVAILAPEGPRAVVNIKHREIGFIPLSAEGDGMRRALAFAAATTLAENGVLLVDEIEAALHPDALAKVFGFLVQACHETNVQLFVTTHSLEAIDAMLDSVEGGSLDDLAAFRLPSQDEAWPLKRFSGTAIRDARREGGLDLR